MPVNLRWLVCVVMASVGLGAGTRADDDYIDRHEHRRAISEASAFIVAIVDYNHAQTSRAPRIERMIQEAGVETQIGYAKRGNDRNITRERGIPWPLDSIYVTTLHLFDGSETGQVPSQLPLLAGTYDLAYVVVGRLYLLALDHASPEEVLLIRCGVIEVDWTELEKILSMEKEELVDTIFTRSTDRCYYAPP